MNYRYMRTILFFDLPMVTKTDLKSYRHFVRDLKRIEFYMLQESVYVKMSLNMQIVDTTIARIKIFAPKKGSIICVTLTEKQFSSMDILIGENKTDVLCTDSKVVIL